jgi:NADH:ubiquinone oxidoreductase subunit 6 (subunit J)
VAFYILILLASISAVAILLVRSVLHAALSLIVCLLAIAGIYVLLDAEFLAVVQILIYAGGILLLIIFGIMITRRTGESPLKLQTPALLLGLVMVILFWYAIQDVQALPVNTGQVVTGQQIGISMMTHYAAPFEAGGLLLLVSLIGAMLTSSFRSRT